MSKSGTFSAQGIGNTQMGQGLTELLLLGIGKQPELTSPYLHLMATTTKLESRNHLFSMVESLQKGLKPIGSCTSTGLQIATQILAQNHLLWLQIMHRVARKIPWGYACHVYDSYPPIIIFNLFFYVPFKQSRTFRVIHKVGLV